jgi:hypothetical protein
MQAKLSYVKWCVLMTYVCAIGRFVGQDPLGAFNDLAGGLFGTFLLHRDPHLRNCYNCLHESPLGAISDGGLQCMMPFLFMAGVNGFFSAVRVYAILLKTGSVVPCVDKLVCFLPSVLCLSAVAQLTAVYFCWKVHKLMTVQALSGIYANPGEVPSGEEIEGNGNDPSAAAHPPSSLSAASADTLPEANRGLPMGHPLRGANFTPFSGTGHQLTPGSLRAPGVGRLGPADGATAPVAAAQ